MEFGALFAMIILVKMNHKLFVVCLDFLQMWEKYIMGQFLLTKEMDQFGLGMA